MKYTLLQNFEHATERNATPPNTQLQYNNLYGCVEKRIKKNVKQNKKSQLVITVHCKINLCRSMRRYNLK